jgi:hypothetical protein
MFLYFFHYRRYLSVDDVVFSFSGIALNQALSENLFVIIVCILNKIPIFVVGKPGTSKTLAIQIIASNLQGAQSPMLFWRSFPAVYIFQYQCSPLSTAASIHFQFEAAKSYQEHSQDILTGKLVITYTFCVFSQLTF